MRASISCSISVLLGGSPSIIARRSRSAAVVALVLVDGSLVLGDGLREVVRAVILGHEVEIGRGVGLHHGLERGAAGVADGAGREALVRVGVVGVDLVVE